ncbi:hypothetical protein C2G38_2223698 [Gigaspora rosea]|uniref:Uncharacterized protein n=1 Tax=Gigaspora rosea TaxID=44941 RepID=A0A397U175_9GLOM|nr:hypothetical protein C2G38_2223698 [Gigaspora rosea]
MPMHVKSSQDKPQLFNNNKSQSESDHSISLSDNDDSEISEEDEEIFSDSENVEPEQAWKNESNEESQLTDSESKQAEVLVHPINNPKGKWKLETLFIDTLDAPTFIGDLKI